MHTHTQRKHWRSRAAPALECAVITAWWTEWTEPWSVAQSLCSADPSATQTTSQQASQLTYVDHITSVTTHLRSQGSSSLTVLHLLSNLGVHAQPTSTSTLARQKYKLVSSVSMYWETRMHTHTHTHTRASMCTRTHIYTHAQMHWDLDTAGPAALWNWQRRSRVFRRDLKLHMVWEQWTETIPKSMLPLKLLVSHWNAKDMWISR